MLPKEITQLVEEIFDLSGGQRKKDLVSKDVEASLLSLLTQIKEDLTYISSVLSITVQKGTYAENVTESRKLLDQNNTEALVKS